MVFEKAGFLYEPREEREFFGNLWIYNKEYYKHGWDNLVAVENIDDDGDIKKIEYYVSAVPARFLCIKIYKKDGDIIEVSTGSGKIIKYLNKLKPVIDLLKDNMLGIKIKKIKGE